MPEPPRTALAELGDRRGLASDASTKGGYCPNLLVLKRSIVRGENRAISPASWHVTDGLRHLAETIVGDMSTT